MAPSEQYTNTGTALVSQPITTTKPKPESLAALILEVASTFYWSM